MCPVSLRGALQIHKDKFVTQIMCGWQSILWETTAIVRVMGEVLIDLIVGQFW